MSLEKHLHIISLNVPYPVDYGGVFDLFYKLPALQAQGVHIHLHCFNYGKGEQKELNKYCVEVNYYERKTGHKGVSNSLPYIVATRANEDLAQNLLKDNYPILMEGVHCTYILNDERFKDRRKYVRLHNVEFEYYKDLYTSSTSILKKVYYYRESKLLKKYENEIVQKATAFWGVTVKDVETYRQQFGCTTIEYLPVYLPDNWQVNSLIGIGNYCLYQADLSVDANEKAATWLLENVFGKNDIPFVIAGKNPSKKLETIAHSYLHTCIVANPGEKEMQDMIAKAHINILPSYHNSGVKIKLLNALYNGRFCIVNTATIIGTEFSKLCQVANTADEFLAAINTVIDTPFSTNDIEERKKLLYQTFNNEANAKQQVQWIWG